MVLKVEQVLVDALNPAPYNPRTWNAAGLASLMASLDEFGFVEPLVVNRRGNVVVGGHMRLEAARRRGDKKVPVYFVDLDPDGERTLNLALNRTGGEWDVPRLEALVSDLASRRGDFAATGFTPAEWDRYRQALNSPDARRETAKVTLADKFGAPPFSVLDARQGYWLQRKKAWQDLGINLEETVHGLSRAAPTMGEGWGSDYTEKTRVEGRLGRKLSAVEYQSKYHVAPATAARNRSRSVFDPVLAELVYRWWCPPAGHVLDPFCGSTSGAQVAAHLGYRYTGIDLNPKQITANRKVGRDRGIPTSQARWIKGDATALPALDSTPKSKWQKDVLDAAPYDLIFTCPPYYNLEKYTTAATDLSAAASYDEFAAMYQKALLGAARLLAPDRFYVVQIGVIRDSTGRHLDLPGLTVDTLLAAGLTYYNEAVLVTPLGNLQVRAPRQFLVSRKLGRAHQTVLVFVKGDHKRAVAALGDPELAFPTS